MSNALSSSTKEIVVLFELTYGSTVLRMCDTQEDLHLPLGDFTSVPTLKLTLPNYTGTVERAEIEAEFASKPFEGFSKAISSSRAHAEVYSRAWQWTRDTGSDRVKLLYSGRVAVATRNPGGRQDVLKLTITTQKAETQRPMGIISDSHCQWTFGDPKTCTKDLAPITETGTIVSVNRNSVNLTGLTSHPDFYWSKGYIKSDDIIVPIKEWISGTTFLFTKLLPLEWEETVIGFGFKTVSVIPGCDKLVDTCVNTWNNASNFEGIGLAIPIYNPFFEVPP